MRFEIGRVHLYNLSLMRRHLKFLSHNADPMECNDLLRPNLIDGHLENTISMWIAIDGNIRACSSCTVVIKITHGYERKTKYTFFQNYDS